LGVGLISSHKKKKLFPNLMASDKERENGMVMAAAKTSGHGLGYMKTSKKDGKMKRKKMPSHCLAHGLVTLNPKVENPEGNATSRTRIGWGCNVSFCWCSSNLNRGA
jgi:hypothetical protein